MDRVTIEGTQESGSARAFAISRWFGASSNVRAGPQPGFISHLKLTLRVRHILIAADTVQSTRMLVPLRCNRAHGPTALIINLLRSRARAEEELINLSCGTTAAILVDNVNVSHPTRFERQALL
jgi:hypothetical protein